MYNRSYKKKNYKLKKPRHGISKKARVDELGMFIIHVELTNVIKQQYADNDGEKLPGALT